MDSWIVALIVAVVQTVVTTIAGTIVGLVIKNKWEKHKAEQEELDKLREEKRAAGEAQRCNLVKTAVHEEVQQLETKVKDEFTNLRKDFNGELQPICNDIDLMKRAMQKDVRRSLRKDGKKLLDRGWATQLEKTEFDELYWAYHNLGRNGVVDALHTQVMNLPEVEPEQKTNKTGTRKKQKLLENK